MVTFHLYILHISKYELFYSLYSLRYHDHIFIRVCGWLFKILRHISQPRSDSTGSFLFSVKEQCIFHKRNQYNLTIHHPSISGNGSTMSSKRPGTVDYSKWDNFECSESEDDEPSYRPAPNRHHFEEDDDDDSDEYEESVEEDDSSDYESESDESSEDSRPPVPPPAPAPVRNIMLLLYSCIFTKCSTTYYSHSFIYRL